MKKLAILGSTGSIGKQTLSVIRENNSLFSVETIAAYGNDLDSIEKQIAEFNPKIIAIFNPDFAKQLQSKYPGKTIVPALEGLIEAATNEAVDLVVSALSGSIGIIPTYRAIEAKKDIALANKEVLVSAGELIMNKAKQMGVNIIPVDSEHNAIFQCLNKENHKSIEKILLTASGGPFRSFSKKQLDQITLEQALDHPTYSMGKKNSIDSSTLMNKGLEIIEACHLFDLSIDQIEVVIHPQSIIHSMVTFVDGSTLAQMSYPDMKIPIRHALHYPNRDKGEFELFDFSKGLQLEFYQPEYDKFLCLKLAVEAMKMGKSMPCFMNTANEVLVNRFLDKQISWHQIGSVLEKLMSSHTVEDMVSLEDLIEIENQAKEQVKQVFIS